MNISENLKQTFKQGNALTRLIFINVAIYLLYNIIAILFMPFKFEFNLSQYLSVPADLNQIILKPWTIITYMFMHENLMHILFNMIALYWFGKIFLISFSEKQLVGLYIVGGLFSAFFYIIAFNLFFEAKVPITILMGASGSIMAIIVTAAIKLPDMQLRMLFIGDVKLKYIAIASVLISFFGVTSDNAGGEIAHLGGALCGYLFIVSLRKGIDITKWVNKVIDFFTDIFSPKKLKVKNNRRNNFSKMTDAQYNVNKAQKMAEIDKILDKIKTSGYESLTSDEKKRLFEQGRK